MLNAAPELRIEYHHSSPSITVMRSPSCIWVTTRYLVPWSMANTTAASTESAQPGGAPAQDARCAAGALGSGFRGAYGGQGFSVIRGGGQGSPRVV